jgi:hypothetical protein
MVDVLAATRRTASKPGRPCALSLQAQVLVTLEYWREYRTYFHISTDWAVSEATICRTVHRVEDCLMQSGKFRLSGKKRLFKGFGPRPDVVVMDVTETPIERPKRKQKCFYSGKKRQHTLKCQIILAPQTGEIICTFFGKGRRHDFAVFKASKIRFHPETRSLQDRGYQGIDRYHTNSVIPKKKPRNGALSASDKQHNRRLSGERIGIEHINRRLKIFRILQQRYRNRRRRFGLRCNLIAALYNYELKTA